MRENLLVVTVAGPSLPKYDSWPAKRNALTFSAFEMNEFHAKQSCRDKELELEEMFGRMWENLISRVSGPMTFRLILQPMMAALIAFRSGLQDAREGRQPYLSATFTDRAQRGKLLWEGWEGIARVFLLAVIIDAIYQWIVQRWFYPGEALLVAIILAVLPYILIRGSVNRVARRWIVQR